MKTILTKKQQIAWIASNPRTASLRHYWSTRGYGNAKILDRANNVIATARGCGYDRRGAVIGKAIAALFPEELERLARKVCKLPARRFGAGMSRGSADFYGLELYRRDGKTEVMIDGACGDSCMREILGAIGFSLRYCGDTGNNGPTGSEFYAIEPLDAYGRERLARIK